MTERPSRSGHNYGRAIEKVSAAFRKKGPHMAALLFTFELFLFHFALSDETWYGVPLTGTLPAMALPSGDVHGTP